METARTSRREIRGHTLQRVQQGGDTFASPEPIALCSELGLPQHNHPAHKHATPCSTTPVATLSSGACRRHTGLQG